MKIKTLVHGQKLLNWAGLGIFYFVTTLSVLSGSLALYFSDLSWKGLNIVLVFIFFGGSLWVLLGQLYRWTFGLWLLSLLAVWLFYNMTTLPSNNREWRTDMALPARAIIDGDNIRVLNYRNFDYHGQTGFTPHYEERQIQLSKLTSVDYYISYWMPGPVAHTFVSFNFSDGPPIAISIEARYESHENYAPISSLFRQFEIIYIVGDERDIVKSRTNHRQEEVYRYSLKLPAENAQRLFMQYIYRINELHDFPEFYNLIKSNCTINIIRYANRAGRIGSFDIRHLINGYSDRYLYDAGLIDTSRPFAEVRAEAHINALGIAAGSSPNFSELIRRPSQPLASGI